MQKRTSKVMDLVTCEHCELQFTRKYYDTMHYRCPDGPGSYNETDPIVVEVTALRELCQTPVNKRKWRHNTTLEKIEEWTTLIGLICLMASMAFLVYR